MQLIRPRAIHVAQTELDRAGVQDYLAEIGAPEWSTDAPTGAEELIEVLGRICYASFKIGLNPNVVRMREGNKPYLENVIKQRHGALVEHAYDTYILLNISRVVSHQIVRHRVGTNYSQASGHYIRVEGIKSYFPSYFENHPRRDELFELYKTRYEDLERAQLDLARILDVDNLSFTDKKRATTAMRRLVPDGIATTLGMTCNARTWRWIIELRTERGNDEEIRTVFADVFHQQAARYPHLYADARVELVDGIEEVAFENSKI